MVCLYVRVAVGAQDNDPSSSLSNAGHVRVYDLIESIWTQVGQDINGENSGDKSGYSLSLSADGTRLVVGAQYNDESGNDSGHVRVYELPPVRIAKHYFTWPSSCVISYCLLNCILLSFSNPFYRCICMAQTTSSVRMLFFVLIHVFTC